MRCLLEGRMLALASADKCIYVYNASDGDYGAKAKCKGHKHPVEHLDFDEFGRRLQTSDSSQTHLYWDTDTVGFCVLLFIVLSTCTTCTHLVAKYCNCC